MVQGSVVYHEIGESIIPILKSERQSLDSKMLGLAALMVGFSAVGFSVKPQMIGGKMPRLKDKMP